MTAATVASADTAATVASADVPGLATRLARNRLLRGLRHGTRTDRRPASRTRPTTN